MADLIAINKADGDNLKQAKLAKVEFNRALHLYPKKPSGWQPKVLLCSGLNNEGIEAIWEQIQDYVSVASQTSDFNQNRSEHHEFWFSQNIEGYWRSNVGNDKEVKAALEQQLQLREQNKAAPGAAAGFLLEFRV